MNRLAQTLPKTVRQRFSARILTAAFCALALYGCHQDMWNQPKFTAYQVNPFFTDNSSARQPVEGTVEFEAARREWVTPFFAKYVGGAAQVPPRSDIAFWDGRNEENAYLADNYFPLNDRELYVRGRERYNITCANCHGVSGYGDGMIVQRGFPVPPSFHLDRLRQVEDGYIYNVITNGFGRMYSYADKLQPEDRWAVIAYIRALQLSQNVDLSDPESEMASMVFRGIQEQEAAAVEAERLKQEALSHGHGGGHGAGHGEDHGGSHETTSHCDPDGAGDTHAVPDADPGTVGGDDSAQTEPGPAGAAHDANTDEALHP